MKSLFLSATLLLILTFISSESFAQQDGTTYHLRIGRWLPIYDPSLAAGSRITNQQELVLNSYAFTLLAEADGGYIIQILNFKGSGGEANALNAKFVQATEDSPIKFFFITKDDWTNFVEEQLRRNGITFGLTNVPIKIRPKNQNETHRKRNLDFEGNVNLGLSIAWYFKQNDETTFYSTGGIAITQIGIDQVNTNNKVLQPEARSGFGYFLGVVYQNKGFQVSALMGWDYAAGEISDYWVYQGKPWVGVGLGIGIFSPDNSPLKKNKTQ
jgi:hypothetical protein